MAVSVIWYPEAQHSELRVGNQTFTGKFCQEQQVSSHSYQALKDKAAQAGRKAFFEFYIGVTPEQQIELRHLSPKTELAPTCMGVVATQLENKAGFTIPSFLAPYPFCSAAYLASLHYLGDKRVKAIVLHGEITQDQIPTIAKHVLVEVVAAEIHLAYSAVSNLYSSLVG